MGANLYPRIPNSKYCFVFIAISTRTARGLHETSEINNKNSSVASYHKIGIININDLLSILQTFIYCNAFLSNILYLVINKKQY